MTGGSDSTAHPRPAVAPGLWRLCTLLCLKGTRHRRSCGRSRRTRSTRRPRSCPGFAHSQTALSRTARWLVPSSPSPPAARRSASRPQMYPNKLKKAPHRSGGANSAYFFTRNSASKGFRSNSDSTCTSPSISSFFMIT